MERDFRLPDLGEGLTEGEIGRWLVVEGQEVAEDDPLVEIATDKTSVEIPSPYAGRVTRIHVGEGEIVPVGTVIVTIGSAEPAADPSAPPPASRPASGPASPAVVTPDAVSAAGGGGVRATPLVRRLAQELGVDLSTVVGTGSSGQIVESDVRARTGDGVPDGEGRRERLRGARRVAAERLSAAHREVPAVTFVEECDFGRVDPRQLVALMLQAVTASLRDFPELNARLEGDEVVLLDRYDIGLAVQTPAGLLVPVVRACDQRSLPELDAEARRVADGARAGSLAPAELQGSTFTITSAGKLGGLLVTPLVNYPEVAILGLHRIAQRPVVRAGEIVPRPIGNVSVTFDHRVVDGARAAAFCLAVIERLQQPDA